MKLILYNPRSSPSLIPPPQAQWHGAEVAVKIIVSHDKEGLDASVSEAVTGRMLAHPFVVNSYVVAIMSGEEVMAAIRACAGSEASGGFSDASVGCGGQVSSSWCLAVETSAAEEIERLLGPGSGSGSGGHGSGADLNDLGGDGVESLLGDFLPREALLLLPLLLPQRVECHSLPPTSSSLPPASLPPPPSSSSPLMATPSPQAAGTTPPTEIHDVHSSSDHVALHHTSSLHGNPPHAAVQHHHAMLVLGTEQPRDIKASVQTEEVAPTCKDLDPIDGSEPPALCPGRTAMDASIAAAAAGYPDESSGPSALSAGHVATNATNATNAINSINATAAGISSQSYSPSFFSGQNAQQHVQSHAVSEGLSFRQVTEATGDGIAGRGGFLGREGFTRGVSLGGWGPRGVTRGAIEGGCLASGGPSGAIWPSS